MKNQVVPLYKQPINVLYRMVNIEAERLGWDKNQIKEFGIKVLGKNDASQFLPCDWINLAYAMRREGNFLLS